MKRLISAVITVIILLSCMGNFCFAASATFDFVSEPSVFLVGDHYNILWSTTTGVESIGYVTYIYDGVTYIAYDEKNGILRTDDYIHRVTIPVEHLNAAGRYIVQSKQVLSQTGYEIIYGATVTSKAYTFTGYTQGDESSAGGINAWVISDVHLESSNYDSRLSAVNTVVAGLDDPDLIVLNGDMLDKTTSKELISTHLIKFAADISGGNKPVVYARGNHETRSKGASYVKQYFSGDSGELYYSFNFGPMSAIVLDCGEDKDDTHHEYGGVVDFKTYREWQTDWLRNEASYAPDSTYRFAICHHPLLNPYFENNWMAMLSDLGTDILVSGHTHTLKASYPANVMEGNSAAYNVSGVTDFPVIEDGQGHTAAIQVTFKNGKITVKSAGTKPSFNSGKTTTSLTFSANFNDTATSDMSDTVGVSAPSTTVEPVKQTKTESSTVTGVPTLYGSPMTNTIKSAAATSPTSIITKPVVFDTGDTYTIAYATQAGVDATGEVYVKTETGSTRKFLTNQAGSTVLDGNLHAVSISKKYLDNNSYKLVSRGVKKVPNGNYGWNYANDNFTVAVETNYIEFKGYSGQETINMFYVSDIESNVQTVKKIRDTIKNYDMLILGGNTVSNAESQEAVTNGLLYNIGLITNGKIPVAFVRGENETDGNYADNLYHIIRNKTNEFYNKIQYGPVTALILDTPAVMEDSWEGYGNTVFFDRVRRDQNIWLEKQSYGDSTYNLVFSRTANLYNSFGWKYSKILNTLGTDLAVFGRSSVYTATDIGYRGQNYATVSDGSYEIDGILGLMLTFNNGNIAVKAMSDTATVISTKTISVNDNAPVTYSDVNRSAWYNDAVNYVSLQRTMVGTSATEFEPETKLTRGMVATVIYRLAGVDDDNIAKSPFTDVAEDKYYAEAVNWAYNTGVVKGVSETEFDPENALTREQLATILYRMFDDIVETADECEFDDFDTVSDYAKEAVASMYKSGIINGMGNGCFEPKTEVSRAMLAQIIYKAGL